MKHIISLKEQSREDILEILDLAKKVKSDHRQGIINSALQNRTLVMLFEKTSTRTRLSFESAMTQLGGHAIFLDSRTSQLSLSDFDYEIQAILRFSDILMFRARNARDVEKAASFNRVPVIDACSEKYHPSQALSDLLTMAEHSGGIDKVKKITWLGIENNVSNTLMLACAKLGIEVAIAAPEVDPDSVDPELNSQADATGMVTRTLDLKEALDGADYVHTDTWMNMEFFDGDKIRPEFREEFERRKKKFLPYQLNKKLIDRYAPDAKIMHCMPFHIGYEISRDAIEHANSIVFDQAENRMHAQKAMILWLLGIQV